MISSGRSEAGLEALQQARRRRARRQPAEQHPARVGHRIRELSGAMGAGDLDQLENDAEQDQEAGVHAKHRPRPPDLYEPRHDQQVGDHVGQLVREAEVHYLDGHGQKRGRDQPGDEEPADRAPSIFSTKNP